MDYKGYIELDLTEEGLTDFYSNRAKYVELLKENQYLVSTNSNYFDCVYDFIFFKKREKLITDQEFNYALELFKWHHFPRKNNLIDTSRNKIPAASCENGLFVVW